MRKERCGAECRPSVSHYKPLGWSLEEVDKLDLIRLLTHWYKRGFKTGCRNSISWFIFSNQEKKFFLVILMFSVCDRESASVCWNAFVSQSFKTETAPRWKPETSVTRMLPDGLNSSRRRCVGAAFLPFYQAFTIGQKVICSEMRLHGSRSEERKHLGSSDYRRRSCAAQRGD